MVICWLIFIHVWLTDTTPEDNSSCRTFGVTHVSVAHKSVSVSRVFLFLLLSSYTSHLTPTYIIIYYIYIYIMFSLWSRTLIHCAKVFSGILFVCKFTFSVSFFHQLLKLNNWPESSTLLSVIYHAKEGLCQWLSAIWWLFLISFANILQLNFRTSSSKRWVQQHWKPCKA